MAKLGANLLSKRRSTTTNSQRTSATELTSALVEVASGSGACGPPKASKRSSRSLLNPDEAKVRKRLKSYLRTTSEVGAVGIQAARTSNGDGTASGECITTLPRQQIDSNTRPTLPNQANDAPVSFNQGGEAVAVHYASYVDALTAPLTVCGMASLSAQTGPILVQNTVPLARSNDELLKAIDDVLSSSSESEQGVSDSEGRLVTAQSVAVSNWTVKNSGKVVAPTSNNYEMWTVVQLRKECTQRKLRLTRTTCKQEQIRHLRSYDATRRAVQGTIDDESLLDPRKRKTKHCFIRLLNVLFFDQFAEHLAHSDNSATREQIDVGAVNLKTAFWKAVGVEFRENTTDYNNLFEEAAANPRFTNIDPSRIAQHDDARLYDMWKKGDSSYVKANSRLFVWGQNSSDFYDFCDGNLDAMYLKICTRVKPELTAFVNCGMRAKDEIDSMNLVNSRDVPATANKSAKWQDQVITTVNRIADIFAGVPAPAALASTRLEIHDEDQLIDRIGKLHQLIENVKENQRKDGLAGAVDPTLEASLRKYQQRLQRYEDQLDALM